MRPGIFGFASGYKSTRLNSPGQDFKYARLLAIMGGWRGELAANEPLCWYENLSRYRKHARKPRKAWESRPPDLSLTSKSGQCNRVFLVPFSLLQRLRLKTGDGLELKISHNVGQREVRLGNPRANGDALQVR